MKAHAVAVKLRRGEEARRKLKEAGLLSEELLLKNDGTELLLPLTAEPEEERLKEILRGIRYRLLVADFQQRPKRPKSYRDLLHLPDDLMELLPTSYDIVGEIIILKLPEELYPHRQEIGEALLKIHKGVRTVALDRGVKGEYRVRDLEVIAGNENLETTHVENQIKIMVDVSKVYFSPRLSAERARVSSQVREGEVVLDMFSGAGPFAITIARNSPARKVYAVDVNPAAYEYLERNIHINHVEDRVEAFLGDALDIVPTIDDKIDRIVMNHPTSAMDFLPLSFEKVFPGGVIHLYLLLESSEVPKMAREIGEKAKEIGRRIKIISLREVKGYSPTSSIFCFDLEVD